jgi:hypothetical protein
MGMGSDPIWVVHRKYGGFNMPMQTHYDPVISAHAVDLLQQYRESVQKTHYNKAGMTPETAIVANMYLFSKT